MSAWHIHIMNARNQLTELLETLTSAVSDAQNGCINVHDPVALDLTVRGTNWPMPKALRVSGSAYGPGRIDVVIDTSAGFSGEELHQAMLRTIYHEFHHVLRWDGPGYGQTLGEAIVSEGLAQHFVHEMMTCPAEPWENAIDGAELLEAQSLAAQEFDAKQYDHSKWFFGSGKLSRWAGYTVGFEMVAKYLAEHPDTTALHNATTPASEFARFLR